MLEFPNPTRSFDEARNAVRFVGYDNMVPITFFVEASALLNSGIGAASETEYLQHSMPQLARFIMRRAKPILEAGSDPAR